MDHSWDAVEDGINRIVSESGKPFTAETIANARDFVIFIKSHCPIPTVATGYWETIILSWDVGFDVEIFGNRLELYRFCDRHTDIKEIIHAAGEAFPLSLLAELPKRDQT